MGKRLIQQRRGKGGPTYRAPSHRYAGKIQYPRQTKEGLRGEVIDLVNSVGHNSPLMVIRFEDEQRSLLPAPLGIRVGDTITAGGKIEEAKKGAITQLRNLPIGTQIYNLEVRPNENGRLLRSSGAFALVVSKDKKGVTIKLPSKKTKVLNLECRATVGVVAGSGRKTKPFMKAGNKMKAMRAKNKLYPRVKGIAMNAVDHPFGGTHGRTIGRATTRSRGLPPGAKVGLISAKKSGRSKGKRRK